MLILGLSSFKNDTAAALMRDGVIEAAIENAKLQPAATRGVPEAAIEFCLKQGSASWKDLDLVAVASNATPGWRRRSFSRPRFSPLAPIATSFQEGKEFSRFAWEWTGMRALRQRLGAGTRDARRNVILLDHHLCHASSAFYFSPFEQALILTLDGEGDGRAGMIATGNGTKIHIEKTISFTDSVGWIYSRITDLIGFIPSKDEHKTQWMSLEGEPLYKDVFLRMLRHPGSVLPSVNFHYFHRDLTGAFEPSNFFFEQLDLPADKAQLTAEQKRNLAASLQVAVTEVVSDLLAFYQKKTGMTQICLGGGVFHNTLLVSTLERKFGVGQHLRSARSRQCRYRSGRGCLRLASATEPSAHGFSEKRNPFGLLGSELRAYRSQRCARQRQGALFGAEYRREKARLRGATAARGKDCWLVSWGHRIWSTFSWSSQPAGFSVGTLRYGKSERLR
jgi:carbamoyltransferase